MSPAARQLFVMHGMKRSGNHAISNWLLPQLHCRHFNNLFPLGDILRGIATPRPRPFEDWLGEQERRSGARPTRLLVTIEDHDLRLEPFVMVDFPIRRLLVIRDSRQLFSSRIRKAFRVDMPAYPRTCDSVMLRAVGLWKQHARCFLGDRTAYPERVAIQFDAWFREPAYRAAVSAALGVGFDDSGFGKVAADGGGSSFDGTRFDGRAHLMSVTDRVGALEPHERTLLDDIFRDRELLELSEAVAKADPHRQLVQ